MRGQAELGCHLAPLYPHAQLSRFYPWFYLYVTHVRSVPRRSAFSYWKRKKAGTAGYEANVWTYVRVCVRMCVCVCACMCVRMCACVCVDFASYWLAILTMVPPVIWSWISPRARAVTNGWPGSVWLRSSVPRRSQSSGTLRSETAVNRCWTAHNTARTLLRLVLQRASRGVRGEFVTCNIRYNATVEPVVTL